MITLKIDVTKITKERLYKGEKGTYLNCVLVETPNSEYSDYMIVESTSKDEREKGVKGSILGNGKILGNKPDSTQAPQDNTESPEDDLPF